ncbi:hypothetical protein V5799_007734 [Amblyomma americanum]|uniref:Uncharacterized protein n=1 Tax=Amblyomma americanum TaxID=6943 RepID=A0AAQ4FFE1_AMBAM
MLRRQTDRRGNEQVSRHKRYQKRDWCQKDRASRWQATQGRHAIRRIVGPSQAPTAAPAERAATAGAEQWCGAATVGGHSRGGQAAQPGGHHSEDQAARGDPGGEAHQGLCQRAPPACRQEG